MSNRIARGAEDTAVSRTVGQNVKRLREARGLSGRQLAARVQANGFRYNHSTLTRMEAGSNGKGGHPAVTVDHLVALATALDVRPDQLLTEPRCTACFDAPPPGFSCRTCGAAR